MRLLLGFLTQSRCAAETQALMAEEKKEFKAEDRGGVEVSDGPSQDLVSVSEQFQDLIWSLEEIGLRHWA